MTELENTLLEAENASSPIREIYDRYVAAFASKDTDRIQLLHAEDGTFWLHTGRDPVQGRAAIAAMFDGFFAQWPQFGFEVHRVLFTETNWILDWSVTAVLPANEGGQRPIKFHALDIIDVNEAGLVARKDTFIDMAEVQAALAG